MLESEVATLHLLLLSLSADLLCLGVFLRAPAMADKEAASVSGGDSCHRCIGSRVDWVKLDSAGVTGSLDTLRAIPDLRRYRLLRRGKAG